MGPEHTQRITSVRAALNYGYTLNYDLILQSSFDEDGRTSNPNVVLESSELCHLCKDISEVGTSPALNGKACRMPSYHSEAELRQSILGGCHLCALFWAESQATREDGREYKNLVVSNPHTTSWITVHRDLANFVGTYLSYHGGAFPTRNPRLTVWQEREKEGPEQVCIDARFSISNASQATFAVASSWLHECLQKHTGCKTISGSISTWPTRLLHIGTDIDPTIRVVYPQALVPYMTLSHRWGDSKPLLLTKSNHDFLMRGFGFGDLPQVFRDFVVVARHLGIQYVWVDSLCIIQDSAADWVREANQMGSVYRGSVRNIAAVCASHSEDSIFTRLHPLCTNSLRLQESPKSNSIRLEAAVPNVCAAPLYTRALVLQERLLPARTLEYTCTGIKRQCSEARYEGPGMLKSSAPKGVQISALGGPLSMPWNYLLQVEARAHSQPSQGTAQQYWMHIINGFAAMDLTYETDRPHALKGVVSTLQQQTGLHFVAGICKEFYPSSLLWSIDGNGRVLKSASSACPTSSCTYGRSRAGHIFRPFGETITQAFNHAEIISWTETILHLKGTRFGPATICMRYHQSKSDSQRVAAHIMVSSRIEWFTVIKTGPSLSPPSTKVEIAIKLDYDLVAPVTVDLVVVASMSCAAFAGLILTRVENTTGLWERIGIFQLQGTLPIAEGCFDVVREYQVR